MAKKSPSASKKSGKVAAKTPTKKLVKKADKPKPKVVKKPAPKPIKKVVAKAAAKPAAPVKVAPKKAEPKKTDQKIKAQGPAAVVKPAEKAEIPKPAMMTKKGKPVESEVAEEEAVPGDAAATKAEKVGKVKPIRIEKGNVEDEKAKWIELFKKYGKEKAINYKMSDTFPSLSPLQHKVLGWGFILKNDNDRLEVLFETGIRMLISNYKQ